MERGLDGGILHACGVMPTDVKRGRGKTCVFSEKVHVCVCVHARALMCVHACVHSWMCACMHVCVCVYVCMHVYVHMWVWVHACVGA